MSRWAVAAGAVFALAVLFVLTTPDRIATDRALAPLPDPTTLPTVIGESRTRGSLPDGTGFVVTVDPGVADDWVGSSATVFVDGVAEPAGVVEIFAEPGTGTRYESGRYETTAGGHLVVVELGPHALEALGPRADEIISGSITGDSLRGVPVLRLEEPFRWGDDDRSPVPMTARFITFEVRRGCDDFAAVCSADGSLQVVWRAAGMASAPPLEQPEVAIEGA